MKESGKKRTKDGFKEFFRCNRAGRYASQATKRTERIQGTRKIGGFCPASMKVLVSEGKRTICRYCSNHIGHQEQLMHLNLPRKSRMKVAAQLRIGIPRDEVLRRMRKTSFSGEMNRGDLITAKYF